MENIIMAEAGKGLTIVQINDEIFIFEIIEQNGSKRVSMLLYEWSDVDHFAVHKNNGFPFVEIFSFPDESYPEPIYEAYRWDAEQEDLQSFDLIAYMILEEGNPEGVIALIEEQLAKLEGLEDQAEYSADRFYYLLGLAYEWMGDERAAVEAYWKVWHDFPESGYAVMARPKLE